jgi:DNA-directed RNA polymerase subunit RPC12/RpoP
MEVQFTCDECGSGIEVLPDAQSSAIKCEICSHTQPVNFTMAHEAGDLEICPSCSRKDFYKQKDFNRKIGVALFVVAAIASIWTYGLSFPVAFAIDYFLFKKLSWVVICYKCDTVFRSVNNIGHFHDFNHEMNDRIKYSDHDFQGVQLEH